LPVSIDRGGSTIGLFIPIWRAYACKNTNYSLLNLHSLPVKPFSRLTLGIGTQCALYFDDPSLVIRLSTFACRPTALRGPPISGRFWPEIADHVFALMAITQNRWRGFHPEQVASVKDQTDLIVSVSRCRQSPIRQSGWESPDNL